ncbi:MAG: hypothetical protein JWO98_3493 [Frankiales bacterium]|nr:hypothetical protein [Frankiales bacterium]
MSPPERGSRPAGNQAASHQSTVVRDDTHSTAPSDKPQKSFVRRHCTVATLRQDTLSQMKRRREASRRMEQLDCGCRDPWGCDCSQPPLSQKMIDAGRDAALHLLDTGMVPMVKFEVLQALWRRGGEDRELAELLHHLADGEVS